MKPQQATQKLHFGYDLAFVAQKIFAERDAKFGTRPQFRVGLQFPTREESVPSVRVLTRELDLLEEESSGASSSSTSTRNNRSSSGVVANDEKPPPRIQLCILGDSDYGHCCVDEISAQHYDCDLIVHFGHTCLTIPRRIPTLFCMRCRRLDLVKNEGADENGSALDSCCVSVRRALKEICQSSSGRSSSSSSTSPKRTMLIYDAGIPEREVCELLKPDYICVVPDSLEEGFSVFEDEGQLQVEVGLCRGHTITSTAGSSCSRSSTCSKTNSTTGGNGKAKKSGSKKGTKVDVAVVTSEESVVDAAMSIRRSTTFFSVSLHATALGLTPDWYRRFFTPAEVTTVCGREVMSIRQRYPDLAPPGSSSCTASSEFRYVYVGCQHDLLQTLIVRFGSVTHVDTRDLPFLNDDEEASSRSPSSAGETRSPTSTSRSPSSADTDSVDSVYNIPHQQRLQHHDSSEMMRQRFSSGVMALQRAKHVGLLFAAMDRPYLLPLASHLEKHLALAGKATYRVSVGKLDVTKLCNLEEIDCWILLACPERFFAFLSEQREYPKPFISPYEAEVALDLRPWDGYCGYKADPSDLGKDAAAALAADMAEVHRQAQADVGGGARVGNDERILGQHQQNHLTFDNSRRAWQGYEDEPAPIATVEQGMTGIACKYDDEQ
ncbi:unnamed protein product [Amoebophrya sp. A25]|nr:unnamed protein product [Amoebophrya sp. A25]|eukprot:GSA25T00010270001.1